MQAIYPELLFSKGQAFLNFYELTQEKLSYCKESFPEAAANLQITANELWYLGEDLCNVFDLIDEACDSFDKNTKKVIASQALYFRTLNEKLTFIKDILYHIEEGLTILNDKGIYTYSVCLAVTAAQKQINKHIKDLELYLLSLIRSHKLYSTEFNDGKALKKKFQSHFTQIKAYQHKIESIQTETAVSQFSDYLKTINKEITLISLECDKEFQSFKSAIIIHNILN